MTGRLIDAQTFLKTRHPHFSTVYSTHEKHALGCKSRRSKCSHMWCIAGWNLLQYLIRCIFTRLRMKKQPCIILMGAIKLALPCMCSTTHSTQSLRPAGYPAALQYLTSRQLLNLAATSQDMCSWIPSMNVFINQQNRICALSTTALACTVDIYGTVRCVLIADEDSLANQRMQG